MTTEQSPLLARRVGNIQESTEDMELSQTSLVGGVHVVQLNELLETLENATMLIKSHMRGAEEVMVAPRQEHRPKPLIPRWVTRYLFLITLAWQALNIGLLEILETVKPGESKNSTSLNRKIDLSSNVVMTVFQALQILLVLFVSFKLVKQVIHHTASRSFIAQAYLSTVLLFAGLFMLMYRFDSSSWKNVSHHRESRPVLIFLRMLYFSVSTATLCGTSETEPIKSFTSTTVALQMLISFVYFASILSLTLLPRKMSRFDPPERNTKRSFTTMLRHLLLRE